MSTSASAKVFALPELLEHILFLACQRPNTIHNYTNASDIEPASQIFTIQRINTTFRDTIQGSKKLLRAMFLLAASPQPKDKPTDEYERVEHLPLIWLCRILSVRFVRRSSTCKGTSIDDECFVLQTGQSKVSELIQLTEVFLRAGASWRRMRISNKAFKAPFTVTYHLFGPQYENVCDFHTVVWRFEDVEKATLGAICDEVFKVESRSVKEHRAAKEMVCDAEGRAEVVIIR